MTNDITTHGEHPVALREATNIAALLVKHQDRISEVTDFMNEVNRRRYDTKEDQIQVLTKALEIFNAFVDTELPTIRNNLELGLTAPTNRVDWASMVALLVGCFPNTNKEDRTIFMQQLALFLEDFQPVSGQLGLAFRRLVRNCKFLPVIAEVREALIDANEFMVGIQNRLMGNPEISGDAGIYNFRHTTQYMLEDATGETERRREEERIERERQTQKKADEEKSKAAAKVRNDAEENYQATQRWAEDTIPRIQSNLKHSPEKKAELIEKVNIELEKAAYRRPREDDRRSGPERRTDCVKHEPSARSSGGFHAPRSTIQ